MIYPKIYQIGLSGVNYNDRKIRAIFPGQRKYLYKTVNALIFVTNFL